MGRLLPYSSFEYEHTTRTQQLNDGRGFENGHHPQQGHDDAVGVVSSYGSLSSSFAAAAPHLVAGIYNNNNNNINHNNSNSIGGGEDINGDSDSGGASGGDSDGDGDGDGDESDESNDNNSDGFLSRGVNLWTSTFGSGATVTARASTRRPSTRNTGSMPFEVDETVEEEDDDFDDTDDANQQDEEYGNHYTHDNDNDNDTDSRFEIRQCCTTTITNDRNNNKNNPLEI